MEEKLKSFVDEVSKTLQLLDRMENYKQFCQDSLSKLDRSLSDLDHKLELIPLDGVQMVKLASKRRQLLLERRICKEEYERVGVIISKIDDTQSIYTQLHDAAIAVRALNKKITERKYTPKELFEDFKIDEMGTKKIKQNNIDAIKLSQISKNGKIHKPSKKNLNVDEKFRQTVR